MRRAVFYPVLVMLVLIAPGTVWANQLDLFGFTSRATGLANAYTAIADGPEATFYNPGALIESRDVRALIGYSFSVPALTLDVQDTNGNDLSDPQAVRDARTPAGGQWINAGVSGGIYDRVYFGLGVQMPVDGSSRVKILNADRPYFLDYDTGIFGMTFLPGMAVQLAPNFGLGASARITVDSFGTRYTQVPTAEGDYRTDTLADSEFSAQASPVIGFYAKSHEFLRFGLTYHGQSYSYYHKTVREQLVPEDEDGFVEIEYEARYNYIPRRMTVAIVGEPDEHVLITGEMSWVGWSAYTAPVAKLNLDFSEMARADIPYTRPDTLDRESANFNDIFVTRFGVETRVNKHLAFRLGYGFEPSPVPDQDGTTTIVDGATHVLAFGVGGNFAGFHGRAVQIDFGIMDHYMPPEDMTKSSGQMQEENPEDNPAWPSYEARAHYIYSGLTVGVQF